MPVRDGRISAGPHGSSPRRAQECGDTVTRSPLASPVLILAGHPMYSAALCLALRGEGMHAVQLPSGGLDHVLSAAQTFPAGVVLLDLAWSRPPTAPYLLSRLVIGLHRQGKCSVLLGGEQDVDAAATAVAAGAVGLVEKSDSFPVLVQTLSAAVSGRPVMSAAERDRWLLRHDAHQGRQYRADQRLQQLSPRESQVLGLLADGERAGAIAERLVVSVTTVRAQIRSILIKLGVNSQLAAVALLREMSTTGTYGHAPPEDHRVDGDARLN